MRYSIRRLIFTAALTLGLAGLIISIMPKLPSVASSTLKAQSKSDSVVDAAHKALEKARANEKANPTKATASATRAALRAYKAAVDVRCTEITARLIELRDMVKQTGETNEITSEIATLEKEFNGLKDSLIENYRLQTQGPELLAARPVKLASTAQFCNTSAITINGVGAASPYPSTLPVSGFTGVISSMTVTLNNLSHTEPDDIDILLVSPGGQNAIIMSDVGGTPTATNVTLTLDDAAAANLPDAGPLVSGTFKPTNGAGADTFPAPAPAPSGGSALSVFNGSSPNGTWSLYVVDDSSGDAGSLAGGWCLNITTVDVAPCTITCPANVTQANDPGFCGAIVNYPSPTTTGDCGTVTCSPASGTFFPTGVTTVTCATQSGPTCNFTVTVTGACLGGCNPTSITINAVGAASPYPATLAISGFTGVVSNVTVTLNNLSHTEPDDIDILLVSPGGQNAIIMSDVGGTPTATNVTLTLDDAAAANLPDAGPLVSGTFKPTNGAGADTFPAPAPAPSGGSALSVFNGSSPNGTWSLYIVDDSGGDAGSIAGGWCLNITTVEVEPCMITCPADVTQANDPGFCGAIVNYPPATTTGTCGTVTCSPPAGSFFPIGTTSVTCSTTAGPTCSFNVIVTGTCPGGCNPTSITINAVGAASPYPATLAISGFTGVVSNVTVTLNNLSHTEPDDIDILLVSPGGQNAIIMSDVGGTPTATNVTLTLDDAAAANLPDAGPLVSGTFKPTNGLGGDTFPAPAPAPSGGSALSVFNGSSPNGTWSLYIVDDSGGDAGSIAGGWCLNITTVQNCVLTCSADVSQPNDPDQCGAVVNYSTPTTTGDCGTVTCSPASGTFFPTGATTVTCTSQSGASCSFTVTVNDTQPPTITCPANQTASNDLNQCGAVVNYPSPTTSDNCPGVGTPVCDHASGSFFPKGTTTVNCTVSDAAGNPASCSFTVTVNDTQPPSINCPANITQSTDPNQCQATVNYPAPTVSDNCPGVGSPACTPASGSTFQKGTTTVNCSVMDASGNSASCSFSVTVNDTQAPTVTCPANIVTPASAGQCSAVVTFTVTASDNCPGVSVVSSPPSGSPFPKGTTTVTATATDASGNTATCSFTVTVVDTQPPTITCPPNQNVSVPIGQPCGVVNYPAPTALDNCPGVTTNCVPPSGSCFPNGTTTVTCTATDASGNTASCSFSVSTFDYCVQDDGNPSIVLRFNSTTGAYIFCCGGNVYTGTGTVTIKPNQIRLQVHTAGVHLDAKLQLGSNKGSASLQIPPGTPLCDISDSDLSNNTCACP